MKKITKIVSTTLAGIMVLSAFPAISASAGGYYVEKPTVKAENVNKGVKISWNKAKKAKKYVVMRKDANSKTYTTIRTVNGSKAGTIVDKKVKAGKTYQYKVKAVNGSNATPSSVKKIVRLTTPTVAVDGGSGIIDVGVGKKSKGAKTYEIYRADVKNGKTGKYRKVDTVTNDEYDLYEKEEHNVVAMFKIRAVNGKSKSAFSVAKKLDYIMEPNANSFLREDFAGIDITWEVNKKVDGFRIYRAENKGKAKLYKDLKLKDCVIGKGDFEGSFIYTDSDVVDGVTYSYYMEAYDGKRKSERTEVFFPVEYKEAADKIKVGKTSKVVAETIEFMDGILEIGGIKAEYKVESEDTSILTVDENNIVHGVAPGKANVVVTITVKGETETQSMKIPIKVIE